jgi:hypothetical protein
MDDFNQLAYLYLKRKRISVPKTKLLKQTVKDDFHLVFKSVMNVFNFLQFDTDDKSLVKKYRIQFIQNFYDQFIENESFHHSLDLDNLKNKQYFEHFGDLLMTFNLKLSAILKYYLKVTKKKLYHHLKIFRYPVHLPLRLINIILVRQICLLIQEI